MPRLALMVARVQALALVGIAVAVLVLATGSRRTLAAGFLATEVLLALAAAALLGIAAGHRRARTPILLVEIIAVGVSTQLLTGHRVLAAVLVGPPALVQVILILRAARFEGAG